MPTNAALAFGALLAGAIVLDYGVKNVRASSQDVAGNTAGSGSPTMVGSFPSSVNPLPGASGGRLDQGIDGTGKSFLSPWSGKIVVANATDSGWKGGGYVAVESDANPNFVYYLAEGISPIVHQGDQVQAGQTIAYPKTNPYNGIVGNFEAGRANPTNPKQPLAQVIPNAASMVDDFAGWLEQLGGPKATNRSSAGRA